MSPTEGITVNGIEIDLAAETLRDAAGDAVPLRRQAFAVLRFLIGNAGRVVTKDEVMRAVWPGIAVTDDSLVQCVSEIRHALRDGAHATLQTVPRRGYRLMLPDATPAAARHRRWRAAAVAVAALVLLFGVSWWSRAPTAASLAVAVLPFDDLSGEARQARFADAFTEDLITELARTNGLKVIARNSVKAYADKATDVREIGRELGVTHVLEGSLELPPSRVRVTAQLIDAATGVHIWSERFDRPADDLFTVRDQVLTRLVGTLTGYDGPLWLDWIEAAKRRPPGDLNAFDYMLMAREPYRRHDQTGVAEARDLLLKAVALDPGLARAWDFLANCYMQDAINGWGDRATAWERYRDATQRAAALDPADAHIQLSLGAMYMERGDVALGTAAWERALELAPNDALVNRYVGTLLPISVGIERAEEGVALVERALYELDPLHPPFYWLNLGNALYFAGRYSEAADALRKIPDPWLEPHVILSLALAQAGELDAARAEAAEVLRLDPAFSAEAWIANDIYQPGNSSGRRFADGAAKAGLPVCAAKPDAIAPADRLAECVADRRASRP
jgi:TolB-like protein/DNA-binding winged helix-turn-helix (wHTH) protein/Tfp pilus assembly protein PilF